VGIGLYDYNARYYDPALGRFVQADTVVPEPGNAQALNRYTYVYNNPLVYEDRDGHSPTILAGIGIGAVVGAAAYALTTKDFKLSECLLVAGVGATAGALIGTGIGAAAGAKALADMSLGVAAMHAGAGAGIATSGGATLWGNKKRDEDFNAPEFVVNSVGGAVDGALTAGIPGVGLAPTAVRAAASGAIGELQYVAGEVVQGRIPSASEAAEVFVFGTGAGFVADTFGQLVLQGVHPKEFGVGAMMTPATIDDAFQPQFTIDLRAVESDPYLVRKAIAVGATHLFVQGAADITVDRLYTPR
jgi:RHS repeat-associated protein